MTQFMSPCRARGMSNFASLGPPALMDELRTKGGKYAKLEDLYEVHLTSRADVSKKSILECLYLGSAQGEFFLSPEYATSI